LLVEPGNALALSEAIQRLLEDTGLRSRFGIAARRRMQELFTFEAQARQYVAFLDRYRRKRRLAA
jgi:glycosyltransferase involved in cell wall biosynthesis